MTDPVIPSNMTNPVIPSNMTNPVIPSNMTNPVIPSNMTDPVIPSNMTGPVMPSNMTDPVMPSNMTDPVIPSNMTNPVIPSNMTNPVIPSNMTNPNEFGGVTYSPCRLDVPSYANRIGPDPLEEYQWYLREDYANVTGAWELMDYVNYDSTNTNQVDIQVGVVDNAVQIDHEDLNILDASEINASINPFVPVGHPHRHNPYPINCLQYFGLQAHGTSVAGVIAAKGNNKIGTKGVAYKAKVWGSNLIIKGFGPSILENVFTHRLAETAIVSNSWGSSSVTRLSDFFRSLFPGLIDKGLKLGFGGKGISYVFSAGNSRRNQYNSIERNQGTEIANSGDRSSYSGMLSHPGIIVVCAVGVDHNVSTYSEAGTNLWLCGYSSSGRLRVQDKADLEDNGHLSSAGTWNNLGLPTLDLSGRVGFNQGARTLIRPGNSGGCRVSRYAFNFGSPLLNIEACNIPTTPPIPISPRNNITIPWDHLLDDNNTRESLLSYHRHLTGTSAAAPLVSGVIALMRTANPQLTWRDVKLILAESARQPDGVAGFITGTNTYYNQETNYTYSEDYGFGIVDAAAAVKLAQEWQPLPTAKDNLVKNSNSSFNSDSNSSSVVIVNASNTQINFIEYVQVKVESGQQIANFGDLHLVLTSPSGINSTFAVPHQCVNRIPPFDSPLIRVYQPTDACSAFTSSFTFGASKHLGENPLGEWHLVARVDGLAKKLNWKLTLYGH
ncbi:MAG: S8 family serine peptidase [Candidatus Portiera sp.]|nr:S8 family serine peptidase [Portiera sp.]